MTLRRASAVLALLLAASLAGCGNKHETITEAETEGIYVDVGGLTYQIQTSRELNPRDIEDQSYLRGLAPGTPALRPDQSWFGVFLRVTNEGEEPAKAAQEFRITDTNYEEGRPCLPANGCFEPVRLDPRQNPFAYTATQIDPGEIYPPLSSASEQGVTGGTVLVFQIPLASYDNRPLEFHLGAPAPPREGTVELDL